MFTIKKLHTTVKDNSALRDGYIFPIILIAIVMLLLIFVRKAHYTCIGNISIQAQADIVRLECKDPDFLVSCKSISLFRYNNVWQCQSSFFQKYKFSKVSNGETLVDTER